MPSPQLMSAFKFVLVFIWLLSFLNPPCLPPGYPSWCIVPAFKFVVVFMPLLLSRSLNAVPLPIVNTPKSLARRFPEGIVRNGDGGSDGTPAIAQIAARDYPIG